MSVGITGGNMRSVSLKTLPGEVRYYIAMREIGSKAYAIVCVNLVISPYFCSCQRVWARVRLVTYGKTSILRIYTLDMLV